MRGLLANYTLRSTLVVWTFGYVLVDIFAGLQGHNFPGGMFLIYVPFLIFDVLATLVFRRLLSVTAGWNPLIRWPAITALLLAVP
jgi:hypothetical protein